MFDVASVKPNVSNDRGSVIAPVIGGRLRATNVTLGVLIRTAFEVEDFQISGGPKWLNTDRYDLEAKTNENADLAQIRRMLQGLLADRFKLVVRRETRTLPVYILTLAKGGLKLSPASDPNCLPPPAGMCGGLPIINRSKMSGQNVSMAQVARVLTTITERGVLDRTGLDGVFNLNLEWSPDQATPGEPVALDAPAPEPGNASIFTALQEQLGLKLESQRNPVEMIVISQVERPSAN